MKSWKFATISAAALLLLAPSIKAQCPAGATPLSVLVGAWSYKAELISAQPLPPSLSSYVAAGTFTASVGTDKSGNPIGLLNSAQSSQINGNSIRLETDDGASTYQGFSDCSGVTLHFVFSTRPVAYDCWFQAGRTILYCVSITEGFPVVLHASVQRPLVPQGSCQPSSSLSVLVTGSNVVAYVPKGNWMGGATGVAAVNVEGASITNSLISTPNVVNSCASSPSTGLTVCTANNTDVYVLTGTTLSKNLTSGGSGTLRFSGGTCTNCGVAMDDTHQRAAIALSTSTPGVGGFQFLSLAPLGFGPVFASMGPVASFGANISEDVLIDGVRNRLLSPSEANNYEIIDVTSNPPPATAFFERSLVAPAGNVADSAGEDCSTGIILAPFEFSNPSAVFIADSTQAMFTSGSPGTWTGPSQTQTLSESNLSAGATGIAVAQGTTHTGVITGEFGSGSNAGAITAILLPATSGGTPAIQDWVTCNIPSFSLGDDPHTVTAYESPSSGHAMAAIANAGATTLAVVDLTNMLNLTRTAGGHACSAGTLPPSVVSFKTPLP